MKELTDFLERIPAIENPISNGATEEGLWWTKFSIDIKNELAWSVVQELGHVINYVSIEQAIDSILPSIPPPYMNGGPRDFLSWIIETKGLRDGYLNQLTT